MTCKYCGEVLAENAKFCTHCGARQTSEPAASVLNPVHTHQDNCGHREEIPVYDGHVVGSAQRVGFLEAVKLAFIHYADFKGRSRRSEYWWFTLFNIIVTGIISAAVPDYSWIWSLIVLVPGIALVVRRLHDVGKSGWFYLWILLPLFGSIIILIQMLKDSAPDNRWGPNPKY